MTGAESEKTSADDSPVIPPHRDNATAIDTSSVSYIIIVKHDRIALLSWCLACAITTTVEPSPAPITASDLQVQHRECYVGLPSKVLPLTAETLQGNNRPAKEMSSSSKEKLLARLDRRDRTIAHLQEENDELSKKVSQLKEEVGDFLDDRAKHDGLKSSWSTYVDETGFALHHVATKSTSSGENSSSRRKSTTTKKSRGTKLKFGSQLSGAVDESEPASERGMSVGDLSGDESSDEGVLRPKRAPLKMADSPSSTKSSNSGDSNGSESEDEMDSPPSVKKRSSDLPSKPKAPKRRKN
ncbi:hypothetical protein THAOC_29159 [Thalassiosira oceanica]|uniref:Uncharacterized protein n=1 Tax=Thalassiosira oceanica TaxID=159749 RepID=K0REL9_THAOC|nr:hypothetical protein THAOC_29159 [Thalassiosira oceanica]|eukprot:EJK51650.1 hypothetical protein THAOC_29159 [Thalassiosira oceanica]